MGLTLTRNPEILRSKCAHVEVSEGLKIAKEITKWLAANNKRAKRNPEIRGAVGLAAPQLGIPKAVAVLYLNERPLPLVNPRIIAWNPEKKLSKEGCLSLPNSYNPNVWRYTDILVCCDNWQTNHRAFGGTPKTFFECCVAQHEISHLYGLMLSDFVDRNYPDPFDWENWRPNTELTTCLLTATRSPRIPISL